MTEFDDAFDPLTIGRRVRSLRQRLGRTLEEFAERIGKAPSQVSVVENGRRELRLSELQQYARALEANVAELLDAAELSEREHLEIALAKLQNHGPLSALEPAAHPRSKVAQRRHPPCDRRALSRN